MRICKFNSIYREVALSKSVVGMSVRKVNRLVGYAIQVRELNQGHATATDKLHSPLLDFVVGSEKHTSSVPRQGCLPYADMPPFVCGFVFYLLPSLRN